MYVHCKLHPQQNGEHYNDYIFLHMQEILPLPATNTTLRYY